MLNNCKMAPKIKIYFHKISEKGRGFQRGKKIEVLIETEGFNWIIMAPIQTVPTHTNTNLRYHYSLSNRVSEREIKIVY